MGKMKPKKKEIDVIMPSQDIISASSTPSAITHVILPSNSYSDSLNGANVTQDLETQERFLRRALNVSLSLPKSTSVVTESSQEDEIEEEKSIGTSDDDDDDDDEECLVEARQRAKHEAIELVKCCETDATRLIDFIEQLNGMMMTYPKDGWNREEFEMITKNHAHTLPTLRSLKERCMKALVVLTESSHEQQDTEGNNKRAANSDDEGVANQERPRKKSLTRHV